MLYKVTPQYARPGSHSSIAEFKTIQDAKLFIYAKLAEDIKTKVNVQYQLLEGMDVLQVFTQEEAEGAGSSSGGSSQRSSGQRFQPTPFATAPKPTGMPSGWSKDEDEKKK